MIKKFEGFKEEIITASAQLPAGNYVVVIKNVQYIQGAGEASDRIEMLVDVAEGEQANFFMNQYAASTDEDKKWKGRASIWIPDGSGTDADKRSVRRFNEFAAYLANANPGYHWDWDETKLKGKKVGAAFRNEHNIIEGREVSYTAFAWFLDADDVRSGKAKLAQEKFRNGATGKATQTAANINDGFMDIPETEEEVIPFD